MRTDASFVMATSLFFAFAVSLYAMYDMFYGGVKRLLTRIWFYSYLLTYAFLTLYLNCNGFLALITAIAVALNVKYILMILQELLSGRKK